MSRYYSELSDDSLGDTPVPLSLIHISPVETKEKNITKLHARQQQLAIESHHSTEKVTIDVRYPRRYEDATDIVDLLAGNESILIDFQYMTCLLYTSRCV